LKKEIFAILKKHRMWTLRQPMFEENIALATEYERTKNYPEKLEA